MPDRRIDPQRLPPDPLEQGLDRLVSAGRQLVDGVSGARPGSRGGSRPSGPGAGPGPGRPRLGELGRWVEDKLEWILEDEDDWREPWQEPRPRRLPPSRRQPLDPGPGTPARGEGRRRPLEAISRRGEGEGRRRSAAAEQPDPLPPEGLQPISGATGRGATIPAQAQAADRSIGRSTDASDDWPDDTSFSRPRWQRPLRDPGRAPDLSADAARAAAARRQEAVRPLPRSSRRRPG